MSKELARLGSHAVGIPCGWLPAHTHACAACPIPSCHVALDPPRPHARSSPCQVGDNVHAIANLLIVTLLFVGGICLFAGFAGDRLEGVVAGSEAVFCALNVLFLYITEQMRADANALTTVGNATSLGGAVELPTSSDGTQAASDSTQNVALTCAILAVSLPLCLAVYDFGVRLYLE
jgi:hypothetical protein